MTPLRSALPATLAAWGESLAGLDAALAISIGPLVHRLDELVGRLETDRAATGEPDGYDGTAPRGRPEDIVLEEWLLADEVPIEFLRRAAEGELRHLHLARRDPEPSGRVQVLLDSGPEQLGGGRLVQLAALVVLDRRARAAGTELSVIDAQSSATAQGPLATVLPLWLRWRSRDPVPAATVDRLLGEAREQDRVWVLGGPTMRTLAGSHRRVVTSQVAQWSPDRAARMHLRVGDATATVDLPEPRAAVAALRGGGLLAPRASAATSTRSGSDGRGAVFTSGARSLLWRGATAGDLHRLPVGSAGDAKVRSYRLPGSVLAASMLGRRTVALLTDGSSLWFHVIGKQLAYVDDERWAPGDFGLEVSDLDRSGPLTALLMWGDGLLVELPSGWWRVRGRQAPYREGIASAAPGRAIDSPEVHYVVDGLVHVSSQRRSVRVHPGTAPLAGPEGWAAVTEDGLTWHTWREEVAGPDLRVEPQARVLALALIHGAPTLVVRTRDGAGRLIRLVSTTGTTTPKGLARVEPTSYSVHPTLPWIAWSSAEETQVIDLETGGLVARIGFEPTVTR